MHLHVLLLLTFGLVQSFSLWPVQQCNYKLYAVGGLRRNSEIDGVNEIYAGSMGKFSNKALRNLASKTKFHKRAEQELGADYRLDLRGICSVPPGWSTVFLETSDKDARMTVFVYMEDWSKAHKSFAKIQVSLKRPEHYNSWVVNIKVASSNNAKEVKLLLPPQHPVTLFPKVEPMRLAPADHLGENDPLVFQTLYTCLFQLNQQLHWPRVRLPLGRAYRFDAQSPISQDTVWSWTARDISVYKDPRLSPTLPESYDTSRVYARDEPLTKYKFGPIVVGNTYQHFGFVSVGRPDKYWK